VLAKVSGTDLLALDISPGEMHLFIQRLERLIEQAKTRIRAEVLSGVVVERPDGKTLVPNQVSKESISKASILRALGPEKGQALLDELREAGALTQISYTEVRAK
jgi:protein-L-isoaspartate O-methyltransferase